MPIYEYECSSCGKQHEIIQMHSETPLIDCPDCGGHMRKLVSKTSFVLKGTGWYLTDYASGERKKAMESEKGNVARPEGKAEKKQSETAVKS